MNIKKLKKRVSLSLITLLLFSSLFYISNNLNITGYIYSQAKLLKEKEMKFMYGQNNMQGDRLLQYSDTYNEYLNTGSNLNIGDLKYKTGYMPEYKHLQSDSSIEQEKPWSRYLSDDAKYNLIADTLSKQINKDSYRDKYFGPYYVFNFDYTMSALKVLDKSLDSVSSSQKVPKALLSAVLFREMMFLGQEDLLDGLPVIGGRSLGICQIGIENARQNEKYLHGEDSYISKLSNEQVREMLQTPKEAVYFCAAQLRTRAIMTTGNKDVDLAALNEKQLKKVLEAYNQSEIPVTFGPVKTKQVYAEETYRYFKLFSEYYKLQEKING